MMFLIQNWQSILSVISTALALIAIIIHHFGHVNHRIALDDINDWLAALHKTLSEQGIMVLPPPRLTVVQPPSQDEKKG